MNIYLLRHGETEENNKKMYYGKRDISLNEKGRKQSEAAGQIIEGVTFDIKYVSQRKRTHETANAIFKDRKNDFIIDERINERNFGIFEGMTFDEIEKKYPREWQEWGNDWIYYRPLNGENYADFYNRVSSFMKNLEKLNCENILVVTHGGVIRTAYCAILEDMRLYWKFASRNGDVSVLKYEYGNWFIDSISHIREC
jgi:alpha-ribazole phosphatase